MSRLPTRVLLLLMCVLAWGQGLGAKGIVVFLESSGGSTRSVLEFTEIQSVGYGYVAIHPSKRRVANSLILKRLDYQLPPDSVNNPTEIRRNADYLKNLLDFQKSYPETAGTLREHSTLWQAEVANGEAKRLKLNGVWMSQTAFDQSYNDALVERIEQGLDLYGVQSDLTQAAQRFERQPELSERVKIAVRKQIQVIDPRDFGKLVEAMGIANSILGVEDKALYAKLFIDGHSQAPDEKAAAPFLEKIRLYAAEVPIAADYLREHDKNETKRQHNQSEIDKIDSALRALARELTDELTAAAGPRKALMTEERLGRLNAQARLAAELQDTSAGAQARLLALYIPIIRGLGDAVDSSRELRLKQGYEQYLAQESAFAERAGDQVLLARELEALLAAAAPPTKGTWESFNAKLEDGRRAQAADRLAEASKLYKEAALMVAPESEEYAQVQKALKNLDRQGIGL